MATSAPSNQGMSEDTKTIIVVLLLVFVLPIGIILMWVWMKWPVWVKLLITIPIIILPLIAILASILVLVINPIELTKRSRDATRLTNLADIQQTIISAEISNPKLLLCQGTKSCEGQSNSIDPLVTNIEGLGWLKINLGKIERAGATMLPLDPVNSELYNYRYCSDGKDWEIETTFESEQQKPKMVSDGGIDPTKYEIGSKFGLCK